jgi:CubicO group peptidase (beta-lactamase class C family)
MGDVTPKQPPPDGIDPVKLQSVVDQVFSDPAGQTLAFVLVYKGQIVGERYGHGANRDTLIEGWSMGKSLLAALIGVLIKDGEFGLYDPAPVPEWQRSISSSLPTPGHCSFRRISRGDTAIATR